MVQFLKDHKKTVVIRPDSGDPQIVNEHILSILDEKLGLIVNTKGYKVLPDCYRIIQGDGNNTEQDIDDVLSYLKRAGYSASNIAFGMGGGLLQKLDRDTQRFAFKTSQLVVDEERRDVCKTPLTDPTKASKKGYLDLVKMEGTYYTVKVLENKPHNESQLVTVFENGKILKEYTLEEVRQKANSQL
jgi:nicotinamide phosphoribosyltransferase